MKIKIAAFVIIILVVGLSVVNTLFLQREINRFIDLCDSLALNEDSAESLRDALELRSEFAKSEKFMSITVNHNDLTVIEEIFSEMIGCLKVNDFDGARIAKSRLGDALRHLGRLSGINIDAII